jgi:glutaredoxin
MGRVTMFGSDDCAHCKRAKARMRVWKIPFHEIDLVQHPYRRNDMLRLTNEYSIPQIFFNEEYIGGTDELITFFEVLDSVLESRDSRTPLEVYLQDVASKPDPSDPRLRLPTKEEQKLVDEADHPKCFNPIGYHDTMIILPDGKEVSVAETISFLDAILNISDRTFNGRKYKKCFVNTEAVTAIAEHFQLKDRKDAANFARDLQQKYKIIDHVSRKAKHQFQDDGVYYFRLQCYHDPRVLNSYKIWTQPVQIECANVILMRLSTLLRNILQKHTDDEGLVDYIAAKQDELYPIFDESVCVLQGESTEIIFSTLHVQDTQFCVFSHIYTTAIDMSAMDETTRLAFGLNLYNLMISYAFVKLGIATTSMTRNSFFTKIRFNVGGHILSLNDLENGLLRANTRHPYAIFAPFAKDDPRLPMALSNLDCRIHFGLNCGAKSCPPVKYFRSKSVDEELRVVALSFCEKNETCLVDEAKHELSLSMLMKWFEKDFCSSRDEIPVTMLRFLKGEKKEALSRMIGKSVQCKMPISIKYLPYDWSANASRFVPYEEKNVQGDKFSALALLRCKGKWNLRSKTPALPKLRRPWLTCKE